MYIRIVVPRFCDRARSETGFFTAAYALRRNPAPEHEPWYIDALSHELDWFDDWLDAPDKLTKRASRKRRIAGVCWFKPTAAKHIARARHIGWLLSELGLPTREIRSDDPGDLIWEDSYQLVAARGPKHPVVFH